MHFDIKTFITKNFPTNFDAFKYFLTPNINQVISSSISKPFRNYLTKKEFFDGLNNLMPKKYTTETILKYYNYYLVPKTQEGLTNFFDQITFSAFSFVYYDKTVSNEEPLLRRTFNHLTKVTTTRPTSFSKTGNAFFDNKPFQTLPHPKLKTPFDNDSLEKLRVLIRSSNKDYLKLIHKAILESGNGIVNHYEFRNIIKSLGLGLTSIEIENIINTSGKTRDNKINLNDFYKFVASDDTNLVKAQHNIKNTLAEIKQLLYKYYSNPKLAFEFSDNKKNNQMDFDTFKSIIGELYNCYTQAMTLFLTPTI
jgi:Ca2+-binding EF-hand superfamily protein